MHKPIIATLLCILLLLLELTTRKTLKKGATSQTRLYKSASVRDLNLYWQIVCARSLTFDLYL